MTGRIPEKLHEGNESVFGAWDEQAFCQFIQQRLGMEIRDHQLARLRKTVDSACTHFGLSTAGDYLKRLRNGSPSSEEQIFLFSRITVGESYFFRDENQFSYLREEWLPLLLAKKRELGDYSLRIWSAGCSEGQELFSVAMMLKEQLPVAEKWHLHLLGTDVNVEALSAAMRGRYSGWSLRATPVDVISRYFEEARGEYALSSDIRRMAKFTVLNLVEDKFPSILTETSHLDLIICRNVFIYFPSKEVRRVMTKFAASLVPGGVLLVGASDPIETDVAGLILRHDTRTLHFQRPPVDDARPPFRNEPPPPTRSAPEPSPPVPTIPPAAPREPPTKKPAEPQEVLRDIRSLLSDEKWSDVVLAVDDVLAKLGELPMLLEFKAKALANLGDLDAALEACTRSIDLDPLAKHAHFLAALIYSEANQPTLAEASLRRVLFLDRTFLEAHFQLGLLSIRNGHRKAGIKSLRAALDLAEQADPDRPIHDSPGMTNGRLAEILRNEISVYGSGDE